MYLINNDCYYFKKINYNSYLFDESICATYIINLVNNGRINSIENQLELFKPTKIVYILLNKGYKNCRKNDYINTSSLDLVDAFLTIFKHSKNNNHKNILILEDDFFFNNQINNLLIRNYINNFIKKKEIEEFIYVLGCIPYLQIPYDDFSNILLLSTGTHSCIYSSKFIDKTLLLKNNHIKDWDVYTNFNSKRYIYKESLCYQLFAETENSKIWEKYYFNSGYILRKIFISLELDKKIYPGYTFFYNFSKILFYIIFILLFIIFILLFKFIYHKNIDLKKNILKIKK